MQGGFMVSDATHRQTTNQTACHEFINSLASVRCLTELLVAYPRLGARDRSRFLGIMQRETERLVRLSDDLMTTLGAVESG